MEETDSQTIDVDGETPDDEWKRVAWRMWLHGARNYTAIAKAVGKHRVTVKKAISELSKTVAEGLLSGEIDTLGEYVDGLYEDLQEADKFVRDADNSNAQIGALKHRSELREKIAAALGVVTKREGRDHSGNVGMYPIPVFSETDPLNNFPKEAEGDCPEAAAEESSA